MIDWSRLNEPAPLNAYVIAVVATMVMSIAVTFYALGM